MLRELLQDPIDLVYAETLFADLNNRDGTPLVREISEFLEAKKASSEDTDLRAKAETAFTDRDFDKAMALYLQAPADLKSILSLIACARFSADGKSARTVLDFVSMQSGIDLNEETEKALEALEVQAGSVPKPVALPISGETSPATEPSDWLSWAKWVVEGADKGIAVDLLRRNSDAWPIDQFCQDLTKVAAFTDLLENASGNAEQTFEIVFDEIFQRFLLNFETPPPSLKPLYRVLLFLLVASSGLTRNDLSVVMQLTSSLLDIGLTQGEYDELIDLLVDLFENEKAISSLDWALDLTESLVLERCQNEEARLRFFTNVSSFVQQWVRRISKSQRHSVETLHHDFGIELPEVLRTPATNDQQVEADPVSVRLAGKRIAIYTLTEPAAIRARDNLKALAPEVEIFLNSDHDCSRNLSSLAKSVDIFVFVWKSAKHQAFYCVKQHRPPELPLVQPTGGGSSSITSAVLKCI